MKLGYNHPLYLLPFDHRQSYLEAMFHYGRPLSQVQYESVVESKRIIFDGFLHAIDSSDLAGSAGILVDEEFGASIIRDAIKGQFVTAVSLEKSGADEFELEYGSLFSEHLESFRPTFAKVLVQYNPEGDAALNQRQAKKLRDISDYCRLNNQRLMFELLVPATKAQLKTLHGDKAIYDRLFRPSLMTRSIRCLQNAGIEPDIWKLEGLDNREDCEKLVDVVQRDGRDEVGCIVLGRGADERQVRGWLEIAASVSGFIGFAVGRTTFWDAIAAYEAKQIQRQETVSRIAIRYREWIQIFREAKNTQLAAELLCKSALPTRTAI